MAYAGAPDLLASIDRREAALATRFGPDLDRAALAEKRALMAKDAFLFLRATCWRWAECAADLCPDLMAAPLAPSVGDAHAGNFGLWIDAEARLVWGVNDLDEAARLPYPLDLVRLGASLLVADRDRDPDDMAEAILEGYARALVAPAPIVLDGALGWLRKLFVATTEDRRDFWKQLAGAVPCRAVPAAFDQPLRAAMPEATAELRLIRRTAGAGSLGRPRFAAFGHWRGGPVAAEIKGAMPSCWSAGHEAGLAARMGAGRFRSPDPSVRITETYVLRRLAPNNRKLDFDEIERNLGARLVAAMAADLAAAHAEGADVAAIGKDLAGRRRRWLARTIGAVAGWTRDEYRAYRRFARGADRDPKGSAAS